MYYSKLVIPKGYRVMGVQIIYSMEKLEAFCRAHRIRRLSFFGSVTRDDFSPQSDVDVLVEFEPGVKVGLIALSGMELELGELISRKVDLNTSGLLNPHFRDEVITGSETVYEQA